MKGQPAFLAMSLMGVPAAMRATAPEADGPRDLCVIASSASVEARYGGEADVVAKLKQGTLVTATSSRGESTRVKYRQGARLRTGWVPKDALGPCEEEADAEDAQPAVSSHKLAKMPELPRPTQSSFHPFGAPVGSVDGGSVLEKSAYDCYHDPDLKYCRWVGYCYQPTNTTFPRYSGGFFADQGLAAGSRAERDDYKGAYLKNLTGFDKGHMAPDATLKALGRVAQKETYSLANITPQYSLMNQGIWRELEDRIRTWATPAEAVCVETGPVFYEGRTVKRLKGPNKLAIPHAYYAIVTQGEEPSVISFVVPNEPERRSIAEIMSFSESVDAIEEAVGFDFLSNLPDDREPDLEQAVAEELW